MSFRIALWLHHLGVQLAATVMNKLYSKIASLTRNERLADTAAQLQGECTVALGVLELFIKNAGPWQTPKK